jgi:hypothetical protein
MLNWGSHARAVAPEAPVAEVKGVVGKLRKIPTCLQMTSSRLRPLTTRAAGGCWIQRAAQRFVKHQLKVGV